MAGLIGTVAADRESVLRQPGHRAPRGRDGTFYAPESAPTIDLTTQVLAISGIDDFVPPRPAYTGGRAPIGGGALQANDFRDGYLGIGSSCAALTGAGQSIGVFTINTGFNQSDIQTYMTNVGLTGVPAPTVKVAGAPDGTTPTPMASDDGGSGLEASMDIEMAIGMAPGAQVVVFEGTVVEPDRGGDGRPAEHSPS